MYHERLFNPKLINKPVVVLSIAIDVLSFLPKNYKLILKIL